MNSLIFIILHSIKNHFFDLLKKPVKLIPYLLIVALIIFFLALPAFTQQNTTPEEYLDLYWLKGIFFASLMLFAIIAVQKGLTSGDSIFEMSDVNLLFVSPISPKMILMYGLVRLMKTSFLASLFVLFQGNWLWNAFGINPGGLLVLFFLFILCMAFLSILSMLIYSITNSAPKRKRSVRIIAFLFVTPLIVYTAMQFFNSGETINALALAIHSPFLTWIPGIGWIAAGAIAFLSGQIATGLAFLGLTIFVSGILIVYIIYSKADYYEDVLVATETAYEKKRAAQSGDINAASSLSQRKIKVAKTGIGGIGPTAIFRKHLRESFRENRFGFLGLMTVFYVLGAVSFSFLLAEDANSIALLQIMMWIQIFMIGTGRGLKELYVHYIYLIPETSFTKIIWSNAELVFKTLVDSLLIFGISGIILGENIRIILAVIITYSLFSLLLIGINYLSLRWTDTNLNAGIMIILYLIAVAIIMAPGLIAALIIGFSFGGQMGTLVGLGILMLWELFAALSCFFFARGVLDHCDMPVIKARN